MTRPLKDREAFFRLVEEGLQAYFDQYDTFWGGILHLTVGVKCGNVGGIIKSENMLSYEGFTLDRVRQILLYALPQFLERRDVRTAVDYVISQLRNGNDAPLDHVFNKRGEEIPIKERTPSSSPSRGRTQSSRKKKIDTPEALPIEGELSEGLRGSSEEEPTEKPKKRKTTKKTQDDEQPDQQEQPQEGDEDHV